MWYFHCIVKLEEVIIKRCKTLCCFVAKWGFQKAGLSYTVKPPVQPQVYRVSYSFVFRNSVAVKYKHLLSNLIYISPKNSAL